MCSMNVKGARKRSRSLNDRRHLKVAFPAEHIPQAPGLRCLVNITLVPSSSCTFFAESSRRRRGGTRCLNDVGLPDKDKDDDVPSLSYDELKLFHCT
ncbi:hypothetical protein AVEN_274273-1 [Araneus ventricosus]|uniref:Uncharacterized protein n=1 Tax=Araneus ventricosus TaxID=182803 RepID=A0A4Y2LEC0_ARAVE|nr:hypothetical protein AVEN_274273-1 [Araneus ventricosus]